jgi:hypothetical protein
VLLYDSARRYSGSEKQLARLTRSRGLAPRFSLLRSSFFASYLAPLRQYCARQATVKEVNSQMSINDYGKNLTVLPHTWINNILR